MLIIPAIDLIKGRCVRLTRGSYRRCKVYSSDPVRTARGLKAAGARRLHIIDLDGARKGSPANLAVAEKIARATGLDVEFGGGIRTLEDLARVLGAGIRFAILGTAAFTDEEFVSHAIRRYGARIVVSVDLKDGFVAVKGWTSTLRLTGARAIGRLAKKGVRGIVYTDTNRDGTLSGVDTKRVRGMVKVCGRNGVALTFAGGVRNLEDIRRLKRMDQGTLRGIVTGKAIYEGTLDLREAVLEAGR